MKARAQWFSRWMANRFGPVPFILVAFIVAFSTPTLAQQRDSGTKNKDNETMLPEPADNAPSRQLTQRPEPYPDDVQQLLAGYPRWQGELLSLFRVIAQSPRTLTKIGASGLLDAASPIDLRTREIVILRVTARYRAEYEWGIHVAAFSQRANLSEAQVRATVLGPANDPAWSETERKLVAVVDALIDAGGLDAAGQTFFDATFDAAQQLEILSLVGFYHTISTITRTAALDLEPGAVPFPER